MMRTIFMFCILFATLVRANEDDINGDDLTEMEDGMLYSVPVTTKQLHDFLEGQMVGFYHSPRAVVKNQCLKEKIVNKLEYALELTYIPHNIAHILDLIKVTRQMVLIYQNVIEFCGIKVMILSMRHFCSVDEQRCSMSQLFTNIWWHTIVIGILSIRILYSMIEIIVYAGRRTSDSQAGEETENTLYDMGEDFGSILRYTLDYHVSEDLALNEWDNIRSRE